MVRDAGELLAAGVARFLPGAEYCVAPEGYARTTAEGPPATPGDALVCLDLESLGFLGRPLFLIGALFSGGDAAGAVGGRAGATRLVQYLARDYSEEEAVVRAFSREAAGVSTWVTFNGRTFDLPLLRLRAAYHRIRAPLPDRHVDLLPAARRLWGSRLPNCRLQTLERLVCGRRPRRGDIDGGEIPRAYHDFVRSGEPWEMLRVLEHNAADLLTLLQLLDAARREGFHGGAEAD